MIKTFEEHRKQLGREIRSKGYHIPVPYHTEEHTKALHQYLIRQLRSAMLLQRQIGKLPKQDSWLERRIIQKEIDDYKLRLDITNTRLEFFERINRIKEENND